jgi:cytochrome P450
VPGPAKGLRPVLHHLRDPFSFFREQQRRHGDIFRAHFPGFGWVVFLGEAAAVHELFGRDAELCTIRDNGFLTPLFGPRSVVVAVDEDHLRQRRLLTPSFIGSNLAVAARATRDTAARCVAEWAPGHRFIAHDAMVDLTLAVAIEVVLGPAAPRTAATIQQVRRTIAACHPALMFLPVLRRDLGRWSPWGRFLRERAAMMDLLRVVVDATAPSANPASPLVARALAAREADELPLPDDELLDHLLTMLVLAHESSAATLAWAFDLVLRAPAVLRRLQDELADAPDDGDALAKLPYLGAVCKEVFRRCPVVPETRRRVLRKPWTVAGYTLDAGSYVTASPYMLHHSEALYPGPDEFRPDRFLGRRYSGHELIPFGGGVRRCIGGTFSTVEVAVALGVLLRDLEFELEDPKPARPRRQNLSVAPAGGVPLRVRARRT